MLQKTTAVITMLAVFSTIQTFFPSAAQGQEEKVEREVVIQPIAKAVEEQEKATKWNARQFPTFGLGDVAILKIVEKEDEKRVSVLLNGFDQNLSPRNVRVTEIRQEQRTRTIRKDGEEIVQTYTVKVPVSKNQVIVQSNPTPQNSRRFEFAVSDVRIWNANSEQLSQEEIESVAGARHVFLVTLGKGQEFKLDPYYASVLSEDVLFVEADVPKPVAKAPPVPAAALRVPAIRALRLAPAVKVVKPRKVENNVEKPIEKPNPEKPKP